jgi:hypothetical protein
MKLKPYTKYAFPSNDTDTDSLSLTSGANLGQSELAQLAYDLWCKRGCPYGTPDEDWFAAEEILRSKT